MEEYRDEIPFGLIEDEEMELAAYKDSLASLTSEPVLYAVDNDVDDKIYTALCNENEDGAYPLFTVPPVQEIKFPEKPDYSGEFTSFKDPVSAYKDGVVDGHKWYEKAFKRLNGWGE